MKYKITEELIKDAKRLKLHPVYIDRTSFYMATLVLYDLKTDIDKHRLDINRLTIV